jgi:hypothetical protein
MTAQMVPMGGFYRPDSRFQSLLGADGWSRLPPAIRCRFGRCLEPGAAITYVGTVAECRRNRFGKTVANLARLIGAPLPLYDDTAVAAIVTVTEEEGGESGQIWTRLYGRAHGLPQIIHSRKRFTGPTGLEEYLGCGVGIALSVAADDEALHFRSDHYFLSAGSLRLRLPRWLSPGDLTISHVDHGDGTFDFILVLHHRLFGEVIRQIGQFQERIALPTKENSHD